MNKPIGIRLDKEIRTKLEKDAKKSGVPLSTYANKILADWVNLYQPMLQGDSTIFPIPLLKLFYHFVKEDDYETIANLISEYWHDSVKAVSKNPIYEDYLKNAELWFTLTKQNFSVLGNHPIKHVIRHTWGYSYSKITCIVLKKAWESLGLRFEELEVKQNLFSYNLYEPE